MSKIDNKILSMCTPENCEQNEFIVLPVEGDVAFEDYYHHKAELVRTVRNLYTSLDENELMLEYPAPNNQIHNVFNLFFESPYVVSKNLEFNGLFAIDITKYVNYLKSDSFQQLMIYIQRNPQMVFILFIRANNIPVIDNVFSTLSSQISIVKKEIPLPDPAYLSKCVFDEIQQTINHHIKRDAKEEVIHFLKNNEFGFEFSETLIFYLKQTYSGGDVSCEDMRKALDCIQKPKQRSSSFGY